MKILDIGAPVIGIAVNMSAIYEQFNVILAIIIGVMSIIYLGLRIRNEMKK